MTAKIATYVLPTEASGVTGVSLQRTSEAGLLILIATGIIVYLVNAFFIEAPTVDDSDDRLEGE
jgi:hypothetical protein